MNLLRRHPTIIAVLLLCTLGSARAATHCATNGAELQAALEAAESNGQADVIRLAQGFFVPPNPTAQSGFQYSPSSLETYSLTLDGGWIEFFENPCGLRFDSTNAFQTVITTGATQRLMEIKLPVAAQAGTTEVTLTRITFLAGDSGSSGAAGGLRVIKNSESINASLLVDQCAFLNNSGLRGAALHASTDSRMQIRNSLFSENHASSTVGAAIELYVEGDAATGVHFTNNTVLDNTNTSPPSGTAGLVVRAQSPAQVLIANNNFHDNQRDISLASGSGTAHVHNNNFDLFILGYLPPAGPEFSSGNIEVDPAYEPGSLNYTPAEGSPLLDAGTRPPIIDVVPRPFERAWSTGTLDINGHTRNQGRIDIGAYEATPVALFSDGFEP